MGGPVDSEIPACPGEPVAPIEVGPVTLLRDGVRLEPLLAHHASGLEHAAADGELWNLWVTSVPKPGDAPAYIETALAMQASQTRLPFAVVDDASGEVVGTTSFHDMVPSARRVEIGYTWYARSVQRTHVNTTCKLLLMGHAFDALGCGVVGWRTDGENHASRRAIAALGAQLDGVVRHERARPNGTVRDTAIFSMLAEEWPGARAALEARLTRHAG